MSTLQITTRTEGDAVRLVLNGEVDLTSSQQLKDAQTTAFQAAAGRELTVDLDHVTFLDSTGIGALVEGRHHAIAAGERFRVVNPHGVVARILNVSGVLKTLCSA